MARPSSTVYVGNLPFDITEATIIEQLTTAGPVKNLRLVNDRETGRFKGYGFCEYYDLSSAESAVRNLDGLELNGRTMRVKAADNFDQRYRSGGAGPGGADGSGGGGGRPPIAPSGHQQQQHHHPQQQPPQQQQQQQQPSTAAGIGYQAAAVSAQQVAALLGAPASSDRALQDSLNKMFATLSRGQLWDIMRQLRAAVAADRGAARQFFADRPGLTKVLFQAQVLLGMVKAPHVEPPAPPPAPPGTGPPAAAFPGVPPPAPAAAAPFQEGPIGLGGPPPGPGGGGVALMPPMHPTGGPLALGQQGGPVPRPMVPTGGAQPMQIMYTPDGQQIMVNPGMAPPGGMVLAGPPPGAQLQPQPLFAGPSPHLQQPGLAPMPQQQQQPGMAPPPPPPAAAAPPPAGGDSTKDLLRQVMVMTDDQINALPEEYRNQVLYVKEQIRIGALQVD